MPRTPLASRTTVQSPGAKSKGPYLRRQGGRALRLGSLSRLLLRKAGKTGPGKRSGAGLRHLPAHEGRKPTLAREAFLGGRRHVTLFQAGEIGGGVRADAVRDCFKDEGFRHAPQIIGGGRLPPSRHVETDSGGKTVERVRVFGFHGSGHRIGEQTDEGFHVLTGEPIPQSFRLFGELRPPCLIAFAQLLPGAAVV